MKTNGEAICQRLEERGTERLQSFKQRTDVKVREKMSAQLGKSLLQGYALTTNGKQSIKYSVKTFLRQPVDGIKVERKHALPPMEEILAPYIVSPKERMAVAEAGKSPLLFGGWSARFLIAYGHQCIDRLAYVVHTFYTAEDMLDCIMGRGANTRQQAAASW